MTLWMIKELFSTIKVYLAAIAAFHIGFDDTTVGQQPVICRFMKVSLCMVCYFVTRHAPPFQVTALWLSGSHCEFIGCNGGAVYISHLWILNR